MGGDDRADAGLVEQLGHERPHVANDLALELVRLLGRGFDPACERAEHEHDRELIRCARVRATEAAAAPNQLARRQLPELRAQVLRRRHDHASQLHQREPADIDGTATSEQQHAQGLLALAGPRQRQHDATTRDYIARRIADGKTTREATRILKRYLARHLYRVMQNATPLTT